jgi:hypothetical protein
MVEISYVKRNTASFCKEVCCVDCEERETAIGRRDLRLADGLSDLGQVCCRGAEHLAPGNEPIQLLSCPYSSNLRVLRIWKPAIVRADMQQTAISMVET